MIDAPLESLSAGELDIEVLKGAHEPTTVQAVKSVPNRSAPFIHISGGLVGIGVAIQEWGRSIHNTRVREL